MIDRDAIRLRWERTARSEMGGDAGYGPRVKCALALPQCPRQTRLRRRRSVASVDLAHLPRMGPRCRGTLARAFLALQAGGRCGLETGVRRGASVRVRIVLHAPGIGWVIGKSPPTGHCGPRRRHLDPVTRRDCAGASAEGRAGSRYGRGSNSPPGLTVFNLAGSRPIDLHVPTLSATAAQFSRWRGLSGRRRAGAPLLTRCLRCSSPSRRVPP